MSTPTSNQSRHTYEKRLQDEIRQLLVADVEAPEGEVGVAGFKAKLRLKRQSSEDRDKIRRALRPKLPTFLEEINITFADVRARLRFSQATREAAMELPIQTLF